MSIFRPREAVSQCEGLAAQCERISLSWKSGIIADLYDEQRRIYLYRRKALIAKYGIRCCALSRPDRGAATE